MSTSPAVETEILGAEVVGRRSVVIYELIDRSPRRTKNVCGAFHTACPGPGGNLVHFHAAVGTGPCIEERVIVKFFSEDNRLTGAVGNIFDFDGRQVLVIG